MKKFFLLILLIFAISTAFSQIHVKENSFHKIEGFVMMDKLEHLDDNDVPMALIKISTENISAEERRKMAFKGNLATYFDVQFKTSEIYLYLSITATFLEIHHPDYGKTEYWLPEDLCDYCGYEMVVVSDYKTEKIIEEKIVYVNDNTYNDENISITHYDDRKIPKSPVLALNYSIDSRATSSYGFTIMMDAFDKKSKFGLFLSVMSNFNFFENNGLECDKDGFIDGNTCYYTGRVEKTKLSLIGGISYKLSIPLHLRFGVGMGAHEVYWEDTEKRMVLNKDYSLRGVDMSVGAVYVFDRINVSVDFVSTQAKTFEIRLGIGGNF